jgi:hypothetical protein
MTNSEAFNGHRFRNVGTLEEILSEKDSRRVSFAQTRKLALNFYKTNVSLLPKNHLLLEF